MPAQTSLVRHYARDAAVLPAEPGDGNALAERLAGKYHDRVTGRFVIPGREGRYEELPADLPPALAAALRARGIGRLYSHQAEAWTATQASKHLAIVTPTASGKSLCYTMPVVASALSRKGKALYLFPTKALAQDQVAELLDLSRAGDLGLKAFTFDGDTPGDARQAIRLHGDIVVSNPDMLHQAILPHHTKWAQFFENLHYVVIDEVHTYRGVFGSHVANVLRRLKRVCAFYGADPQFILCSATIGNPKAHAEALIEADVEAITESGAPTGDKHVLLWNPPVVNPDLGLRASARSQSNRIARVAIKAGLKTLVFAQSRTMVEVLTKYLKDVFDHDPRKPARIRAYRGGYLPTERREAERAMRDGRVDGIVSTSALELGVDIGSLDAVVLNGYPGSIAATWQRFGRAGRRQQASLGILVASSQPLDQYVVRHPEFFADSPPEHARIAPDQPMILLDHIRCAAFELPFLAGEMYGPVDPSPFLQLLDEDSVVHREGDRYEWIADSYPANAVSLRSVADGNFVVVDRTDGRQVIIAEVDFSAAPLTLYEGAIHMVQSTPYRGTAGLGRPQGLRHPHPRGLLHRRHRLHEIEGAGALRWRHRGAGHLSPWRGACGATRRRLQEDPLLHAREHRLRAGEPAGPGDAHHQPVVATAAAGAGNLVRIAPGGTGWLPWRGACAAHRGDGGGDGRGARPAESGGRWRRGVVRIAGYAGQGAIARWRRPVAVADIRGSLRADGVSVRQLSWRHRLERAAVAAPAGIARRAADLVDRCDCKAGCPACVGPVLAADEDADTTPRALARRVLHLLDAA